MQQLCQPHPEVVEDVLVLRREEGHGGARAPGAPAARVSCTNTNSDWTKTKSRPRHWFTRTGLTNGRHSKRATQPLPRAPDAVRVVLNHERHLVVHNQVDVLDVDEGLKPCSHLRKLEA
jgi:hypothetical protein